MVFHKKCQVFTPVGVAAVTASPIFFFFKAIVLMMDSFILKWWVTVAVDLNLQYISSNSPLPYNVITFLWFLGALPESLMLLLMGPMVSFKVYGITPNMMKNIEL